MRTFCVVSERDGEFYVLSQILLDKILRILKLLVVLNILLWNEL